MRHIRTAGLVFLLLAATLRAQPAPPAFAGRPMTDWIADLDSKDVLVREEAVEVLGRIGSPAQGAVEKLAKMYREDERTVRERCALALWRIDKRTGPILAVLRDMLASADRTARLQALERITQIGSSAAELGPDLIELWKDPDAVVQARATSVVLQMGTPVLPSLITALSHPDKEIQRRVLDQFATSRFRRDDVLPALRKRLDGADGRLRVRIARVIRQLDPADKATLPILIAGVSDKDASVRAEALIQCLNVFPRPAELTEVFRRGLKEPDAGVRFRCAQALWEIDRKNAKELAPALIDAVKAGPVGMEWQQAVSLLGSMGSDAKEAMPAIVQLLQDGKAPGQEHFLMTTLSRFGPESAAEIARFVDDARPQYRFAATAALAQLGPAAADYMAPLLKHNDADVRRVGFELVHRTGIAVRPVLAQLEAGLGDRDPQIRWLAAESLSRFGPEGKAAVRVLIDRLNDNSRSWAQKSQAALALGRIGPGAKDALPSLHADLKGDDLNLKLRVAEAIWKIENKPDAALPVLIECLTTGKPLAVSHTRVLQLLTMMQASPAQIEKAVFERVLKGGPATRDQLLQPLSEGWPNAKEFDPLYRDAVKSRGSARLIAAQALLRCGEKQIVIDALKESMPAIDYNSRQFCYTIAAELGPDAKAFNPQIKERWLRENNLTLRIRWAEALLKVDRESGKEALTWLHQAMHDPAPLNRQVAAIAIARIEPENKEVLQILLDLVKGTVPASQGPIIDAIGQLGPHAQAAVPTLKSLLKENDARNRIRAALALWRVEAKLDDVLPAILAELPATDDAKPERPRSHQMTNLREAVSVLAEIGPPAKRALPALRLAAHVNDDSVSWLAVQAIRRIEGK